MTHTTCHTADQRTPAPRSGRRPLRSAAALVLAFCLLGIVAVAHAAIDPWPSYQPQTVCSPTAKKGTLELARYLQKRYPGTGSYGISRACGSGGRSEHKEGRAFDWRVNVYNAKERGYAYDFIRRVRARDSAGNNAALARRMGIMYIIWNDVIYSSARNFAPKAYLNSGCASKASCSATLRHRNHVHISLTRAGGHGRTSWYGNHAVGSGGSAPSGPTPSDLHEEDQNIPTTTLAKPEALHARPGATVSTRLAVRKGRTVKVTAFGVNRFGPGHQLVSDATCVWNGQTRKWEREPRAEVDQRFGDPEVKVNGVAVFAKSGCRGSRHVYTAKIVQKSTARIKVTMGGRNQGQGAITVVLSKVSASINPLIPPLRSAVPAPAAELPAAGKYLSLRDDVRISSQDEVVRSDEVLEAGVDYQVTVTGVRRIGAGVLTDGQCLGVGGRWEPQGSLDLFRPGATHGALYLGGVRFVGEGPPEDPSGCNAHRHTMNFRPAATGRVALRLWDPTGNQDNEGTLNVRFERVDPVPLPTAAPAETAGTGSNWTRRTETLTIRASNASGRTSALRLRAGNSVTVRVRGSARVLGGNYADASCVSESRSWTPSLRLPSGQDLFELYVDGQDVDWRSTRSGVGACDSRHEYSVRFTATKSGPLRFALADLDHRDNSGELTVTISRD